MPYSTFHKRLAAAMTSACKTPSEVAKAVGVSTHTMRAWMKRDKADKILWGHGVALARFLNVRQNWLFDGTGRLTPYELQVKEDFLTRGSGLTRGK